MCVCVCFDQTWLPSGKLKSRLPLNDSFPLQMCHFSSPMMSQVNGHSTSGGLGDSPVTWIHHDPAISCGCFTLLETSHDWEW